MKNYRIYTYLITSILVILVIFSSCSNSDNDDIEKLLPNEIEKYELKLHAFQEKGNIFELQEFSLISNREATMLEIRNTYDSLVWVVPELGRVDILGTNNFIFKWSHNFFLPGEYKSILLGYKNQTVICADTVILTIENNNDFLSYNWEDVTNSSTVSTGYHDFLKHTDLSTSQHFEAGTPSVDLFCFYNSVREKTPSEFAGESKDVLYNLITELYSEPKYDNKDNNQLSEQYKSLFKTKKSNAEPLCIWLTPRSQIVLLKYKDSTTDEYDQYIVHAEPVLN